MLLRRAWLSSADVAAGTWPRQALIGRELAGRTMGLVGYGSIARQVAQRAADLGMTCIGYDPFLAADNPAWGTTKPATLQAVLAQADVVSLHTPLTAETRHMIDAPALSAMRSDAILINAARGGIVDEAALANALRAGSLGGAALDVFETEPLTAEAGAKFAGLPNLLLTPHIAGVTDESNVRVSGLIADRVLAHLERCP
jgi:(S)-sulfolactate dehydrogenase